MDRSQNLQSIQKDVWDLLIIGGGITGAGTLRDAASRGLKACLIEAQDFAQGTSSRSSKLIHGGIRYLENLDFGLVFESLSERHLLFEIAPHLVHPLRFQLPLYKDSRVTPFKMGLGMLLYDALALFRSPEMHRYLSAEDTLEEIPILKSEGLVGSFEYSDAWMDDDLLVLENIRSAYNLGAPSVNYCKCTSIQKKTSGLFHVQVHNEMEESDFEIRAKHIVSAVGPWTDIFGKSITPKWKPLLRPTKGIHIVLDKNRLPIKQAVVMASDNEKRIVFVIPRQDSIIIGTTDTDFPNDPGSVKSESEDIRYLLNLANHYFKGAKLTSQDILASYSGVRPLIDDRSNSESKTSREHLIFSGPLGITFVTGGKFTSYRSMAEHVVEFALKKFSIEEQVLFKRSRTKEPLNKFTTTETLAQAQSKVFEWAQSFGRSVQEVQWLVHRHGLEAENLLKMGVGKSFWSIEAQFAIEKTMCLRLVDFLCRRSQLFLTQKDQGLSTMDQIAKTFSEYYGWDNQKLKSEYAAVMDLKDWELGWLKDI